MLVMSEIRKVQSERGGLVNADWLAPNSNGRLDVGLDSTGGWVKEVVADWSTRNSVGEIQKTSSEALYNPPLEAKLIQNMTEIYFEDIYVYIFWRVTVEFLKLVWLLYILILIWLAIYYVNNFCIEINFRF